MQLQSGPAKKESIIQFAIFLFVFAWGLYFFYDWKVGYPKKNRTHAIEALPTFVGDKELQDENKAAALYDSLTEYPTKNDFGELVKTTPKTLADVQAFFDRAPDKVAEKDGGTSSYYLSKTGAVAIETRDGRMQPLTDGSWRTWHKTKDEVQMQFYFAFVPIALSLLFLRNFIRARRLTATLDDEMIVYGDKKIPYTKISRIDRYNPKGWVDVYYLDEAGDEKRLRVDKEKIAKFDEIIAILSEKKGIENPILVYNRELESPTDETPTDSSDT